jgi:hypothetical protein
VSPAMATWVWQEAAPAREALGQHVSDAAHIQTPTQAVRCARSMAKNPGIY